MAGSAKQAMAKAAWRRGVERLRGVVAAAAALAIACGCGIDGKAADTRFRDALTSGGEGLLMAVVPAGSFTMGSPSHEHQGSVREVTIAKPFALRVHEVTVSGFERLADETGHSTASSRWT